MLLSITKVKVRAFSPAVEWTLGIQDSASSEAHDSTNTCAVADTGPDYGGKRRRLYPQDQPLDRGAAIKSKLGLSETQVGHVLSAFLSRVSINRSCRCGSGVLCL